MSSNNSLFLDVDDTILKKNLILPGNALDEEFDGLMKQQDSPPFFIIQPTPGACIKTKIEDTGEKLFLNICTSDKIPPPRDIPEAELLSFLMNQTPTLIIPMSIGYERQESDKSGNMCSTYDIAINPAYFKKCQEKESFWLFTISAAMEAVSEKFNKKLETSDYVVLKHRKAMGKLQLHRIENREPMKQPKLDKPLIEEISSSSTKYSSPSMPGPLLLRHPAKGTPTLLIGLFTMPKGSMGKDVSVLVYTDRIVVEALNNTLLYDIDIPYKVQAGSAKSFLDTNLGVLRVNLPIDNEQGGSKVL